MAFKIYLSPAAHATDNPCSFDRAHCGENVHCNAYMDELEPILRACGFDVRRNPKDRTGDKLHFAIEEANAWGADLYLVTHTNAGGGAYSKFMVYDRGTGYQWARIIAAAMQPIYTNPRIVAVEPQWAEISQTKMPCVYHEIVFHDNLGEITYFHHHLRDFALCVAQGICQIFGVPFVNPYAAPEAPATPILRVGACVHYEGRLYSTSGGLFPGRSVDGTFTVTRIISGRKCGVLLNNGLGWVPASACNVVG